MRRTVRWIGLFLVAPCTVAVPTTGSGAPMSKRPPLFITHVAVIDCTGASLRPDQTVEVVDGRIRAVRRSQTVTIPEDAEVLDGRGKFLIPGLWDMHVHVLFEGVPELFFPLFLANGVTGIRDMSSDLGLARRLRERMAADSLLGPRIVAATPIIDGPTPYWPGSVPVKTEAEARDAVRSLKEAGADFVKLYSGVSRECYFAILEEAGKADLAVSGHVPTSVRLGEASDSGQRCIEHLDGWLRACSTREDELREAEITLLQRVLDRDTSAALTRRRRELQDLGRRTFSESRASALVDRLARNRTWQDPTLVAIRLYAVLDDSSYFADPRLKYMPDWLLALWDLGKDPRTRDRASPEELAFARWAMAKNLWLVGAMQRAGVGLLAGSDALSPYCFPGFSLHDELEMLVQAGLTPLQALQCATRNPARFLNMESGFGTIQPGKVADLVLLEANPLQDIRNTRRIEAVVRGGTVLRKRALETMLSEVEAAARVH